MTLSRSIVLFLAILSVVVLYDSPLNVLAADAISIDEYWPLKKGNLWVYDDGELESFCNKKRLFIVKDTGECQDDNPFLVGTISRTGLSLVGSLTTGIINPPIHLTKKYPAVGDTIETYTSINGMDIHFTSSVVGFEDVIVPAGTFNNCLKLSVYVEVTSPPQDYDYHKTYFWFAEGVGIVKMQVYERMPGSTGCFISQDERNLLYTNQ